jgi:ubiquinone/menaquinone biosynthesis C-methylase UbiE
MTVSSTPGALVREGDILVGRNAPRDYWGEIPEAEFDQLLGLLGTSLDFDCTILDFFSGHPRQDLYVYITDTAGRGAGQSLLEREQGGIAVDLGAGMGAITEVLSTRFAKVWAIEGCRKRCEFLAHRKRLKGLQGVEVIHGDMLELPLESSSIDLAVCNGGLEWVAVGRDGPVRPIQKRFLAEIARVLKPGGILHLAIENRFGRQYLRGAPDHPGSKYTSLLPRWLATIVLRCQRTVPGFSVSQLTASYRNFTYSARGLRHLLAVSGLPYADVICVEPSYDVPRFAFNLRTSKRSLGQFFEALLKRRFHPIRDRALCNNYWVYASKNEPPKALAEEPLYFGYYDTLVVEGSRIRRTPLQGDQCFEDIILGPSLLQQQTPKRAEDIAAAYLEFLSKQVRPHAIARPELVGSELRRYLGSHVDQRVIANIESAVAQRHSTGQYHGDFWLGNLLFDRASGRSVLIDPEPQIFGSRELDVADFAIDLWLNRRRQPGAADLVNRIAALLGVDLRSRELILTAVARQVLRYTPVHRSHALVFTYLRLLIDLVSGTVPQDLGWLTRDI